MGLITIIYVMAWFLLGAIPNIFYRILEINHWKSLYPESSYFRWDGYDTAIILVAALLGPLAAIPGRSNREAIAHWISTRRAKKS